MSFSRRIFISHIHNSNPILPIYIPVQRPLFVAFHLSLLISDLSTIYKLSLTMDVCVNVNSTHFHAPTPSHAVPGHAVHHRRRLFIVVLLLGVAGSWSVSLCSYITAPQLQTVIDGAGRVGPHPSSQGRA